ncbi:MAG: hypothetical protein JXR70_19675 [Spirochaetales bacterium]|nr:hypothetical protein [Spirochaetales bacterium]
MKTMVKEKIYKFNINQTKSRLVKVLKKNRNEATVADLVAASGLPTYQVQESLKVVLHEYRGHLKATESGELLYYFPQGMVSQLKGFGPRFRRFLQKAGEVLAAVFSFLFKIWIMVMLVGYFVLFVVILLAAIAAAIAISFAGNDKDRRSSSSGVFRLVYLVINLFTRIWFYRQIFKEPGHAHAHAHARAPKPKGRPLNKAVFAYVFGEDDPNAAYSEQEKKAVLSWLRRHKGVITLEEFIILTGKDIDQAQADLSYYMLEFEGQPEVTEEGAVLYFFPELLRSSGDVAQSSVVSAQKRLVPFSANDKKQNGWITFFNGFNLVFGSYFLYFATQFPTAGSLGEFQEITLDFVYRILFMYAEPFLANPALVIMVGLGFVPLVFSVLFYLIPFIRNQKRKKSNELVKQENLRKALYSRLLSSPEQVYPSSVAGISPEETPKGQKSFIDRELKRLSLEKSGEIHEGQAGEYYYSFSELAFEKAEVQKFRDQVDLNKYLTGKAVFDSGE